MPKETSSPQTPATLLSLAETLGEMSSAVRLLAETLNSRNVEEIEVKNEGQRRGGWAVRAPAPQRDHQREVLPVAGDGGEDRDCAGGGVERPAEAAQGVCGAVEEGGQDQAEVCVRWMNYGIFPILARREIFRSRSKSRPGARIACATSRRRQANPRSHSARRTCGTPSLSGAWWCCTRSTGSRRSVMGRRCRRVSCARLTNLGSGHSNSVRDARSCQRVHKLEVSVTLQLSDFFISHGLISVRRSGLTRLPKAGVVSVPWRL